MEKQKKICIIGNKAPHYRLGIYQLMDKDFNCKFIFGKESNKLHTLDYSLLRDVTTVKNVIICKNLYWQKDTLKLLNLPFDYYIIDGEPKNITSWVILLLSIIKKKKVVSWSHGWYGHETKIKTIIKKMFYKMFYYNLIYGERSINIMVKNGFKKEKLFQIANSLNFDEQSKIYKSLKTSDIYMKHYNNNNPVLIYVGRQQKIKQLNLIIESISILKNKGIDVNCIIVGEDTEQIGLRKLAEKLNVENNYWEYGPCYNEHVIGELFFNADICVSPGNVGLTAIHSLTYGCPVITNNDFNNQMPEFEAIINGITGAFFSKNDASSLAFTIENWLKSNSCNRRKISVEAFRTIETKWNYHYQIEVMKKLFILS